MRQIAYQQRPPELDMLGLEDALRSLARRTSLQSNLKIEVNYQLPVSLEESKNVVLFRVTQEGITNAIRHSKCQTIQVNVYLKASWVFLTIHDDGEGISDCYQWGGGLNGAHGRVSKEGGKLLLTSRDEGGSSLTAQIPI